MCIATHHWENNPQKVKPFQKFPEISSQNLIVLQQGDSDELHSICTAEK